MAIVPAVEELFGTFQVRAGVLKLCRDRRLACLDCLELERNFPVHDIGDYVAGRNCVAFLDRDLDDCAANSRPGRNRIPALDLPKDRLHHREIPVFHPIVGCDRRWNG